MADERYLIPRNYSPEHEAAEIALNARLWPIAGSPTARTVVLTYWVDGADRPLERHMVSSMLLGNYRRLIPLAATHMTIECADG